MLAQLGLRDPKDAPSRQSDPVSDSVENNVMCSYLDGIAARRGIRSAPH
jgi:hypothetical protein